MPYENLRPGTPAISAMEEPDGYGYDMGSQDDKFVIGDVDENGILRAEGDLFRRPQKVIRVGGQEILILNRQMMEESLDRFRPQDPGKLEYIGGTGLSGTGIAFAVNGQTEVIVYGKPAATVDKKANVIFMEEAGIPESANPLYVWGRIKFLVDHWEEFAQESGLDGVPLGEVLVGPAVNAIMEELLGLEFGTLGIGPDEWKGWTGKVEGATPDDLRRVLRRTGFREDQASISESRFYPAQKAYLIGDFPLVVRTVATEQALGNIDMNAILEELDSNGKIWTETRSGKVDVRGILKRQINGAHYRILTNALGVHGSWVEANNLVRPLLPKEDFYLVADQSAGLAMEAFYDGSCPFMYFPETADEKSIGVLWHESRGVLTGRDLAAMNQEEKNLVIAALYAGIAGESLRVVKMIKDQTGRSKLLLTGGAVRYKSQEVKRNIFGATAEAVGIDTYVLENMADPAEMALIQAATEISGRPIQNARTIVETPINTRRTFGKYHLKWLEHREKAFNSNKRA